VAGGGNRGEKNNIQEMMLTIAKQDRARSHHPEHTSFVDMEEAIWDFFVCVFFPRGHGDNSFNNNT
jgi:hypothetical protein